jgi:tetratricopeptide (TPR) repeat protein
MKNKILLYSVIIGLFSFKSWTQKKTTLQDDKKSIETANSLTMEQKSLQKSKKVKYYHVEEIVPLQFGGHTTIYNVSKENLIQTYDLGPNNKRIVTPVFIEIPEYEQTSLKSESLSELGNAKLSISDAPKKADTYEYIDIIKTYERVADRGYESIDMLKKVANSYFFNDELEKAEKCYSKLFSKTSDLEPEYYYRYAIALKAVGKVEKSNEYLQKFNLLSGNNTQQ